MSDLVTSLGVGLIASIIVFFTLCWVFWLWMFIECLQRERGDTNDKLIWALIIFFVPFGCLIYFIFRRPNRIQALGE